MTFDFTSWQLVSLLVLVLGSLVGFGKLLLVQIEKQLTTQFRALSARAEKQDGQLDELSREVQRVDRDLLKLQGEMPLHYVRREDYVRNQTVIEAKLDAIALRFESGRFESIRTETHPLRGDKS